MPVTVSDSYIANLALAEISARSITSLSDDTNEARWCSRFYAQCRDELLHEHPWNFAIKRTTLSRLVDAPVSEWAFAYGLPADFIRLYQLNGFTPDSPTRRWEIEAGQLLTDEEEASIRYVCQQTDTTKFSPQFVTALSLSLASRICKPITGNDNTALIAKFELSLRRARRADAREGKPRRKDFCADSALVRSRFVSGIG